MRLQQSKNIIFGLKMLLDVNVCVLPDPVLGVLPVYVLYCISYNFSSGYVNQI